MDTIVPLSSLQLRGVVLRAVNTFSVPEEGMRSPPHPARRVASHGNGRQQGPARRAGRAGGVLDAGARGRGLTADCRGQGTLDISDAI
jgi:hypothetical protein